MDTFLLDRTVEEKLVTLRDVTWEQFKGIEAQLIDNRSVRLSYLSGILEIMSPVGPLHEYVKRTLGLLLETYIGIIFDF
ncbi:Uma2 family endonuclease [Scytonema hofmannii]|uniref:Uma2 family endonuclease n=1 Tax=Scytonema hofmannii TaxID=34078 RepID=UPI00034728B7|nr:Uma2 family endonuclease [Scytonema hofmannii]